MFLRLTQVARDKAGTLTEYDVLVNPAHILMVCRCKHEDNPDGSMLFVEGTGPATEYRESLEKMQDLLMYR